MTKTIIHILMCADKSGDIQPVCGSNSLPWLNRKLSAFQKAYENGSRLWDVSNSYIQCIDLYLQEKNENS